MKEQSLQFILLLYAEKLEIITAGTAPAQPTWDDENNKITHKTLAVLNILSYYMSL